MYIYIQCQTTNVKQPFWMTIISHHQPSSIFWGFLEWGVSPVIILFMAFFSIDKPTILGYPHCCGNLHISTLELHRAANLDSTRNSIILRHPQVMKLPRGHSSFEAFERRWTWTTSFVYVKKNKARISHYWVITMRYWDGWTLHFSNSENQNPSICGQLGRKQLGFTAGDPWDPWRHATIGALVIRKGSIFEEGPTLGEIAMDRPRNMCPESL